MYPFCVLRECNFLYPGIVFTVFMSFITVKKSLQYTHINSPNTVGSAHVRVPNHWHGHAECQEQSRRITSRSSSSSSTGCHRYMRVYSHSHVASGLDGLGEHVQGELDAPTLLLHQSAQPAGQQPRDRASEARIGAQVAEMEPESTRQQRAEDSDCAVRGQEQCWSKYFPGNINKWNK